jgi:methylamine---glutamate N-methyltransferase subunit B
MRPEHYDVLGPLLKRAGCDANPSEFKRYGSARKLYHFQIDHAALY